MNGAFDAFYVYMINYQNREIIYGYLAQDLPNINSINHQDTKKDHDAFMKAINDFYSLYDKYMEEQDYELDITTKVYKPKTSNFYCWKRFDSYIKNDEDVKKMLDYINTKYASHITLTPSEVKAYFAQETGDYCMKAIKGILPKSKGFINPNSKTDKYVGICQLPQYDDETGKYTEETFQEAIDWAKLAGVTIPMKASDGILSAEKPEFSFKLGVAYLGKTIEYLFDDRLAGHFPLNNPNSPRGIDFKCMLFASYNTGNGTLRGFVQKFDSNKKPKDRYNWLESVMPFYAKSDVNWKWQTECTIGGLLWRLGEVPNCRFNDCDGKNPKYK